jgi:hypothetical protein
MTTADSVLISRCLGCGAVYRSKLAGRRIAPGEYSSGYCHDCLPAFEREAARYINTMTTQRPGHRSDLPGDGRK